MLLSVVFPVYNEEEAIPILLQTIRPVLKGLDCDYEILFVNDGSRDRTAALLKEAAAQDRRIKLLSFSRNFGHQMAITAGMDFASGDAVVIMDADLQDPPELLPEMVRLFREGYDVVSPQRIDRNSDSWFKKWTAQAFYSLMRRMVDKRLADQVGDFRLFSRSALLALRGFREQHRFMRGLVAWLGLNEITIPYVRQSRAAGTTKYPLWKMVRFAWTAISSFSALPLQLATGAGLLLSLVSFGYFLWALILKLKGITVVGWASIVFLQCLFSGVTLFALGLVGEYVAKIYDEAKGRPLYVLREAVNLRAENRTVPRTASVAREDDLVQRVSSLR
jgi:dolichol-phosphate mannosyltransferase